MSDRAALESEREFLLRSLDDLDAEHAAGDMADADYQQLRDTYTSRAAAVLRELEETQPAASDTHTRRPWLAWVSVVGVIAVVSGVLLARSVDDRGAGGSLTGSGSNSADTMSGCLMLSFQQPKKGIACYAKVLKTQPDNTEALTYTGWAKIRSGDTAGGKADLDRVVSLDPKFPDVYVFRASEASRREDYPAAQKELDTLYSLKPSGQVLSTLEQMGLDRKVAFGNLSKSVQPCWKTFEQGIENQDRKKVTEAIMCFADVIAAEPDNLDALKSQGYVLGQTSEPLLMAKGREALDRAVALAPADPTVRLLRAALLNVNGDHKGALAELDVLATLSGRPSPLYVTATPEQMRQDAQAALNTPSTTTTTVGS